MSDIYLDLTETLTNPLRTGIQRVIRETVRHWPAAVPIMPCCIDRNGTLRRIASGVLGCLSRPDDGTEADRNANRQKLNDFVLDAVPLDDRAVRKLLCLELYYDPVRVAAHIRLARSGCKVLFLVYDFLPYLRPDLFPPGVTRHLMHFLRLLGEVGPLAFVSDQTKRDFLLRIARNAAAAHAPVFLPGADGFGLEHQAYSPERRSFVSIGTVARRKNFMALFEGFESLWNAGVPAELVVAGAMSPGDLAEQAFLARHADTRLLTVHDQPTDMVLRSLLRKAVAVVMPSEAEGFGLPPYEAVSAGIPAIASRNLPSAEFFGAGALLLDVVTRDTIGQAVASVMDGATASELWRSASEIHLPRWATFSSEVARWAIGA